MVKYLLGVLLLNISCFKMNNLKLENIQKELISKKLLNLFEKGEDIEKLLERLKQEAIENNLRTIYTDRQLNLLMLTLKSSFDKKEIEETFTKILLCICMQEDIISVENFNKSILENTLVIPLNPFKDTTFKDLKEDDKNKIVTKIFSRDFKFNLKKFKNQSNFLNFYKLKALLDERDEDRQTLIFYSFYLGQKSFIDFLIDIVDLEITNKMEETPIVYAISKRPSVIKYLYASGHIDKFKKKYNEVGFNRKLNDPLIYAVLEQNAELVNILLSAGFDPNSTDENKNKAILLAASVNADEIVNILLSRGAKYLNKEKLLLRKAKKVANKAGASVLQLASDVAFRASGAPVSLNTSSFNAFLKNSHTLNRTQAYTKVYKIFLTGEWIKLESMSYNTITKFKDLLSGLKYYFKYPKDKNEETDVKHYHSFPKKIVEKASDTLKGKQNDIKAKVLKLKGVYKNLKKLEAKFNSIRYSYLEDNLKKAYETIQSNFFKQNQNDKNLLEREFNKISSLLEAESTLYDNILNDGKGKGLSQFYSSTSPDKQNVELDEGIIDNLEKKEFNIVKGKLIETQIKLNKLILLIKEFNAKLMKIEEEISKLITSNFKE